MSELHEIVRASAGSPRADVIFVHGLGGHHLETWQHDKVRARDCWPYWLAEALPEVSVWTLEYDAAWHRWFGRNAMSIADRAFDVLGELVRHQIGRAPIVFICHSLGGLVIKQTLASAATLNVPYWQPIINRTQAIVFVATPHAGADLASILFRLGQFLGTSPAFEDLRAQDANLRYLNTWYRQNAARLGIRTLCYFETRPSMAKRFWFLPWGVTVVGASDADPGINDVIPSPLDCDHGTICKPTRRESRLCHEIVELIREISIEPAETAGDESRAAAEPLALPEDPYPFEGRETELAALIDALEDGGHASVAAIEGMGGVGKSALAIRAAHRLAASAPHGRFYLDLAAASERPLSALEAIAAVLRAFDPRAPAPASEDDGVRTCRTALYGKRVLLVLDNARNAAVVAPLVLQRPPSCVLIITSREAMPFPYVTRIRLEELYPNAAVRLLRNLLGLERASLDELATLAERCGYLPLALHAAASVLTRQRSLPVADYLAALSRERGRLSALRR